MAAAAGRSSGHSPNLRPGQVHPALGRRLEPGRRKVVQGVDLRFVPRADRRHFTSAETAGGATHTAATTSAPHGRRDRSASSVWCAAWRSPGAAAAHLERQGPTCWRLRACGRRGEARRVWARGNSRSDPRGTCAEWTRRPCTDRRFSATSECWYHRKQVRRYPHRTRAAMLAGSRGLLPWPRSARGGAAPNELVHGSRAVGHSPAAGNRQPIRGTLH